MIGWRRGLSGAKTSERLRILDAECRARQMALVAFCDERCSQHPIGLAECSDVRVFGSKILWRRRKGRVLVHITVWIEPTLKRYTYKWRLGPRQGNDINLLDLR
jgi:hypothetical protein